MIWWLYAKQFPKYALVFGIIAGSTALFTTWWMFHSHAKAHSPRDIAAEQAAIRAQTAKAEARIDYLFLADDDLYDAGTGECLFKNWLHGDHPLHLFFDPKSKKILGQYDRGFARYAFDGMREAAMMRNEPLAFCDGFKKVVFAKNKNVWIADADWQNFRFANERQVTTIDSFYEQNFAANILLLTTKTLVVRNLNNLLRVNLETGNVKPMRMPLVNIAKQRSPDSRWLVGTQSGQFFCYDVDADNAKTIPIGRNGISDFQWLGSDKCIGLAAGKEIVVYDRPAHTLTENATLPFPCFKIGEPSPDGRFIFAAGGIDGRNGGLVDLEKKTATPIRGGAGITWASNDTFAFSRDVLDSDLRGIWTKKIGEPEKRVSVEPCLLTLNSLCLVKLQTSDKLIILETTRGFIRMRSNDIKAEFILERHQPSTQISAMQNIDVIN